MSYEKDFKITFYNQEDNEELSDQYSELLMINRDGEVFELVHNGRGEYSPSYEGDWIGYKIKGSSKTDEYEAKAKAFDEIREARKEILVDVHERGFNIPADQDKFTLQSENIINKYESGESND
ncbi:hypothetical protein [Jeotgalicoccus halotolerans]|uniref:Uncharacterized protein n=1 Tax=Jeotgalicoccus halotolerans TaxID=157227 RepID=A0A3E0AZX0_9STAP|nr:hypothetical protein [Jeotgalicoccus halotolerans]REG25281.1 hypothetical protein DFR63_0307 [Jeotgalicoccus halotolerans]